MTQCKVTKNASIDFYSLPRSNDCQTRRAQSREAFATQIISVDGTAVIGILSSVFPRGAAADSGLRPTAKQTGPETKANSRTRLHREMASAVSGWQSEQRAEQTKPPSRTPKAPGTMNAAARTPELRLSRINASIKLRGPHQEMHHQPDLASAGGPPDEAQQAGAQQGEAADVCGHDGVVDR